MIYITDFTNLHSNSKIKKQNNQLSHSRNYLKFYKNQNYDNFEKTLKTPSSYVSFGNTTSALLINPFAEGSEEILEFLGIADIRNDLSTSLPYGTQRKVEVARALASDPKMILIWIK